MTRDENKLKTSFSTIGSPGSAFRFCGLWLYFITL